MMRGAGSSTVAAMLGDAEITAFVATTDAERAKRFYCETLGLRLVADEEYALVLDANGTMLRVQKVEKLAPQPFTSLGWNVPDIAATIDALVASGVAFERYGFMEQDDRGVWTAPGGAKIAWFKDPDGNTLSIAEM
jgi:catechol 2,3-dioxygenase-like lactoylglutathione lyase family enzyme